jgi:hypothetical protein
LTAICNYSYDFEEVNNAVETETESQDESSHIARTESKTHGEDETENASCNESQSRVPLLKGLDG